jgi:hypothetical protein
MAQGTADSFYAGIKWGFLVAAGIAVLGVFVSAIKDD